MLPLKKLTLVLAITAQFSEKVGQGRHKYQSITIVVIFFVFPMGFKAFLAIRHACLWSFWISAWKKKLGTAYKNKLVVQLAR